MCKGFEYWMHFCIVNKQRSLYHSACPLIFTRMCVSKSEGHGSFLRLRVSEMRLFHSKWVYNLLPHSIWVKNYQRNCVSYYVSHTILYFTYNTLDVFKTKGYLRLDYGYNHSLTVNINGYKYQWLIMPQYIEA